MTSLMAQVSERCFPLNSSPSLSPPTSSPSLPDPPPGRLGTRRSPQGSQPANFFRAYERKGQEMERDIQALKCLSGSGSRQNLQPDVLQRGQSAAGGGSQRGFGGGDAWGGDTASC